VVLNHYFWTGIFRREFAPQLRAIVETLEKRVLPAFDNIDGEANAVAEETWDAFMSAPGTGDEDPGDFAEAAQDAGVSHYSLHYGIRQGMVNLFAAALYHAFEQQLMMLLRREILNPREENDRGLFQVSEFQKRLKGLHIDISTFPSWATVDELRLVANTVKHAEGAAAHKLHQVNPDLFVSPRTAELGLAFRPKEPRVFSPLLGEDLYVTLGDVERHRDALLYFWQELGKAMEFA